MTGLPPTRPTASPARNRAVVERRLPERSPTAAGGDATARAQETRRGAPRKQVAAARTPIDAFNLHRQSASRRARTLGMILIPLWTPHRYSASPCADVRQACIETYGPTAEKRRSCRCASCWADRRSRMAPQGHRDPAWAGASTRTTACSRRCAANTSISSATAPLPAPRRPWRSTSARAQACWPRCSPGAASTNRGHGQGPARARVRTREPRAARPRRTVEVVEADLFPESGRRWSSATRRGSRRAPARPWSRRSTIGKAACCRDSWRGSRSTWPDGEGWLMLSDIAEHLGLRSRDELLAASKRQGSRSRNAWTSVRIIPRQPTQRPAPAARARR